MHLIFISSIYSIVTLAGTCTDIVFHFLPRSQFWNLLLLGVELVKVNCINQYNFVCVWSILCSGFNFNDVFLPAET